MKNSYRLRYGQIIAELNQVILFSLRWSVVDALALSTSLDSSEIQKWFHAKFFEGKVPKKVLLSCNIVKPKSKVPMEEKERKKEKRDKGLGVTL